ncbi:MAG: type II secretion system protein [Candidatus Saccharimonadales bacterium]
MKFLKVGNQNNSGFTIVELLIVIVVIGILAAITIVAYNGIQTRARATALVSGIKSADKAFRILAAEQSRSTWWRDSGTVGSDAIYFDGPGNPGLNLIIANSDFGKYLQRVPSGSSTDSWQYDNDGDSRLTTACQAAGTEGAGWTGVVLAIAEVSNSVLIEVDKQIDDGNIYCGKVRASSVAQNGLLYQLSFTQTIE